MAPQSLLFVCIGNTCRSPMAAALAKRMWSKAHIRSAGVRAIKNYGAADEAITTMAAVGLDIRAHATSSIADHDLSAFQFIVALDNEATDKLVTTYQVDTHKIIELYVKDPYGHDLAAYRNCALAIKGKLEWLASTKGWPQA